MRPPGTVARDPSYDSAGYAVVRELIGAQTAELLESYAAVLRASGRMEVDHQVPGSLRRYAAPGFEALLDLCTSPLSTLAGRRLLPTYSFVRYYFRGQELSAHRDRPECEHSVTLHLASSEPGAWPIWIRQGNDEPAEVLLHPGDAVLYRGNDVLHWRDPLEMDWYLQVFLHYVDADGPFTDRHLDGRPHLAAPRGGAG